jgi:phosphate starvation-inducible PhoH-like protein
MSNVTLTEEGLESLFGTRDQNLRLIEKAFGVTIGARGAHAQIDGDAVAVAVVTHLLSELSALLDMGFRVKGRDVETAIRVLKESPETSLIEFFSGDGFLASVRQLVTPRSLMQQMYLKAMAEHDMVMSIGPAGTGKTYLAVAMAAAALKERQVRRILLARPAVEAGERLGFLPGDLVEKVNPYLRPLYDALYDIIGFEKVSRMLERGTIEVAPIAFMRGRTLNDAFVILDEAQNTTTEQMKMFLTRIGFNSKAVVTGDITQVDLPPGRRSGLREATRILAGISGIRFIHFTERDVVRHPLVQKIIAAYERDEQREERTDSPREPRATVDRGD